jgi:hypothetical protein
VFRICRTMLPNRPNQRYLDKILVVVPDPNCPFMLIMHLLSLGRNGENIAGCKNICKSIIGQ